MLSLDERRQLLNAAEAARDETCWPAADALDAAGIIPGSYDLGDGRIRLKAPIDELVMDAYWKSVPQRRTPTLLTIFDDPTPYPPDAFKTTLSW